jgi:hypothetical protein
LGTFGHGLRNPIFPKNLISCHNQSVYPRHPLYSIFGARFEKSDFGKKSDSCHNQSVYPRHPLYSINFLGTFGHGLKNPILAKNLISCHNQSVYPRHPLYSMYSIFGARFEKSDFGKKSDFLAQSIRLSPSSVVLNFFCTV